MREEQKTILNGLREIRYRGELAPFGFTDTEIGEVIEEDNAISKVAEQEEALREQPTNAESAKQFILDGILTEEEAYELRRRALLEEYEKETRTYFEMKLRNDPLKDQEGKKNKMKFRYEIFTYRPQDDTTIAENLILQARHVPMKKIIGLDARGFAKCPFHNERTASFHAERNLYYCFGCGEKGDTIRFVQKQNKLSFVTAVKYLLGK